MTLDWLGSRVAIPGEVPAGGSLSKLLYSEHARRTADAVTNILGAAATISDHPEAEPWSSACSLPRGCGWEAAATRSSATLSASRDSACPESQNQPSLLPLVWLVADVVSDDV